MADLEKYGRTFAFDDDVPEDVQHKRIDAWMRQNAPSELESVQGAGKLGDIVGTGVGEAPKIKPTNSGKNANLSVIARALGMPSLDLFSAAASPEGREHATDKNTWRTLAQGMVPFADEGIAGVRSMIPGQPSYSDALNEERQGLKDYEKTYGPGAKMATELTGAGLSTLATMGGASALQGMRGLPWLTRAAEWTMANPWKSAPVLGGTTGALQGFGAGEGGFKERAENAVPSALIGAGAGPVALAGVKGTDKVLGWANTNNRVADFLRRRLLSERDNLRTSRTLPRNAEGDINPNTPAFVDEAMPSMRTEMRDMRNRLYTDPMVADLLPNTAEQVLQKRGPATEQLAQNMLKRQYDKNAPEVVAKAQSQRGRVENAFDLAFGADNFKRTDEQLLEHLKGNADQLFKPAYQHNLRSQEIDDALDRIRILNPNVWAKAKTWADADRRSIGNIDATGNLRSYNTQFLHDIKRSMDEALGAEKMANPKFNDLPYLKAKTDLNNAMKEQNGAYKIAMEQYGDDASRIAALKKGREEVFVPGSEDLGGGMSGESIKAHLADPNISQAEKDLFKLGAARGLRENTLSSSSKKYTHNWSDFINNPTTEERMGALLTDKMGSWDLLRAQLKRESENYKGMNAALGNSKTSAREEMKREMEGMDVGRIAAGAGNPGAFGTTKAIIDAIKNKVDPGTKMANRVADILGRQGARGNRSALNEIEARLRAQDARRALYDRLGVVAPTSIGNAWPRDEQ